jgi:hypothetical protein
MLFASVFIASLNIFLTSKRASVSFSGLEKSFSIQLRFLIASPASILQLFSRASFVLFTNSLINVFTQESTFFSPATNQRENSSIALLRDVLKVSRSIFAQSPIALNISFARFHFDLLTHIRSYIFALIVFVGSSLSIAISK